MLPGTVTGSWARPRWFDVSMWGRPLDTCMLDAHYREIAFFKATAITQGCNIVRKELGLETSYVSAAAAALQTDTFPKCCVP